LKAICRWSFIGGNVPIGARLDPRLFDWRADHGGADQRLRALLSIRRKEWQGPSSKPARSSFLRCYADMICRRKGAGDTRLRPRPPACEEAGAGSHQTQGWKPTCYHVRLFDRRNLSATPLALGSAPAAMAQDFTFPLISKGFSATVFGRL